MRERTGDFGVLGLVFLPGLVAVLHPEGKDRLGGALARGGGHLFGRDDRAPEDAHEAEGFRWVDHRVILSVLFGDRTIVRLDCLGCRLLVKQHEPLVRADSGWLLLGAISLLPAAPVYF